MDNLLLTGRLLLAGMFAIAGTAKLMDQAGSRRTFTEFGVPKVLVGAFAVLLPVVELAVSVGLLPAASAWWAASAAAGLFLVFIGVIAWNWTRGRKPDCHCFGQLYSEPAGWRTLARNSVLACVAGVVVWQGPGRTGPSAIDWVGELSPAGVVGVLAAAAALALLVAGVSQLRQLRTQGDRAMQRLDELERRLSTEPHPAPAIAAAAPASQASPLAGLPLGTRAPSFRLQGLRGETLGLEALLARARSAVLLFMDPQCGPCRALLPKVGEWQRAYPQLAIAVLSRGDIGRTRAEAAEHDLRNVLLLPDEKLAAAYQVGGTPSAVLVEQGGLIGSPLAGGADAIRLLIARAVEAAPADPSSPRLPEPTVAALVPQSPLDPESLPRPDPAVTATAMDDDLVVYDARNGQGHVLNATAALVWGLLDGQRTTAAVAESLATQYGLPFQQALDDVRELVQGFRRAGLVA